MKKIPFVFPFFLVLFLAACSSDNDQISVRFHNVLAQDITDAEMQFDDDHITNVGFIPAGDTTDYIVFDYFEIGDESWPMGALKGEKSGAEFTASPLNWCGTGLEIKQLDPGYYQIEIEELAHPDTSNWQRYYIRFGD